MPRGGYGNRNWTENDLYELEALVHAGRTPAQIAKRLGRSKNAVCIIRKRRGLRSVTDATLNARKVARTLGVDATTVARWCRKGWLRSSRSVARGDVKQFHIQEDDLLDFLATPEHWMCWSPECISDMGLREWAYEQRTYRWLRAGEVAARYGVVTNAVAHWIRKGYLPAVQRGNNWIPEPALEGFTPPYARDKSGQKQTTYTDAENARLLQLRGAGMTWRQIANAMGRTSCSVSNRYRRIITSQRIAA